MSEPRGKNGDFPYWPDEPHRHQWKAVMDLATGKVREPLAYLCWHCGTTPETMRRAAKARRQERAEAQSGR